MPKRLKDHREVCHYWANQVQPSGYCGNVLFEGPTIYSYGKHFPMGTFTDKMHDDRAVVLMTTRKYSMTTAHHVSMARQALPPDVARLDVPYVLPTSREHAENMQDFQRRVDEETSKLSRARSGVSWAEAFIHGLIRQSEIYAEVFSLETPPAVLPENLPDLLAKAREREARKAESDKVKYEAHQAAREERRRLDALELPLRIQAWREGRVVSLPWNTPPLLRLSKDGKNVETSMGASVPLDHAKRVYNIVKQVMKNAEAFHANGRTIPIGVYTVTEITTDGTLKAGCHTIMFDEMQRFAKSQGWEE